MNNQLTTIAATASKSGISLRFLVNRLMNDSLLLATQRKSYIVNEISLEMELIANEEKIAPVINELLTTVLTNSRNGKIHITAEKFRDVAILEIQDRNNYNGYALAYSILSMESQATTIGGYITMKGQQQLVTTISFGFPNTLEIPTYAYAC
ncbi:MAG TPA: hypothetical protein VF487_02510 [Chitinophagaceae bacterium]